jgi:hypothetical protein
MYTTRIHHVFQPHHPPAEKLFQTLLAWVAPSKQEGGRLSFNIVYTIVWNFFRRRQYLHATQPYSLEEFKSSFGRILLDHLDPSSSNLRIWADLLDVFAMARISSHDRYDYEQIMSLLLDYSHELRRQLLERAVSNPAFVDAFYEDVRHEKPCCAGVGKIETRYGLSLVCPHSPSVFGHIKDSITMAGQFGLSPPSPQTVSGWVRLRSHARKEMFSCVVAKQNWEVWITLILDTIFSILDRDYAPDRWENGVLVSGGREWKILANHYARVPSASPSENELGHRLECDKELGCGTSNKKAKLL